MYQDYLRIFEGDTYDRNLLHSQFTGSELPRNITSIGPKLLMVFDSDNSNNQRGFKARIMIEDAIRFNATHNCTIDDPCSVNEGNCILDGHCEGGLKCGLDNCPQQSGHMDGTNCCYDYCGQFLDLDNGTLDFDMPYGNYYGDMQECSWYLQAPIDHILSLEFLNFKVCHQQPVI